MNLIKNYFKIWWIPVVSYIIPISLFVLGNVLENDNLIDASLIVFFLNILGNIISAIVQVIIKKWYFIFPQLIVSIFLFIVTSVIFTLSPPDYYGVGKEIPKNIKFEMPIHNQDDYEDSILSDFELFELDQPGIYTYRTNYRPLKKGFFYIKVFEFTANEQLTIYEINEKSKVIVSDLNQKSHEGNFTIYEGSWGDKYGSRIELWFKPENETEYKILEKNYIVERWMR